MPLPTRRPSPRSTSTRRPASSRSRRRELDHKGPTGQVNNANPASFLVGNGGDGGFAHFIFANLNGTIAAWDTGSTAFIQVTTPGPSTPGWRSTVHKRGLCRQRCGDRQRRRLRQHLRPGYPRGRRFCLPRAARRAGPFQRAGDRR